MARRAALAAPLSILLLAGAALALHAASPTTSDPDGFYHIRHAWLYRTGSLFDSSFPWARFSAIRAEASDLWYGLHLLLAPLTLGGELLDGLRAGGVLVTAAALVMLWAAFRSLGLVYPLVWVLVFAATGDVLFRITMLRPQPLSLGLALLALGLLARPATPARALGLGLAAFVAAWIHLALFWLLPLVGAAFALAALAQRRRPDAVALAALGGGSLLGALLRPSPAGALRLVWIQLGLFLEVKQRGLALPFGVELEPLVLWLEGPRLVMPALAVLACAVLLAWRARRGVPEQAPTRAAAWASLALCLLFAALSLRVASRSFELAAAFGAAALGLLWSELWRSGSRRVRAAAALSLALLLGGLVPMAVSRYLVRVAHARPLLAYRGASTWLQANARPGDLVFHAWWDQFPHLFFWNPKSHYVSGMDPLFFFAHDEALFWKAQWLARDERPETTCGRPACGPRDEEDTALVLRRDFAARFVLVHRPQNPALTAYLMARPDFPRVFDDGTDVVFGVRYDPRPASREVSP